MPTARTHIAILYTVFAIVSIIANLGAQKLFLLGYDHRFAIPLSVLFGTAVGLLTKFVLDKTWIFRYQHRNLSHGVQNFALYSLMGVATTAVFWAFEFGAEALFRSEEARFVGGAIGLSIGYVTKYWLDKTYVFSKSNPR
ncbi:GtrA family protein [Cupriavidus sp. DB3]|uniref:GtrA family protein n=1 Tax=Cupriavidus sp. DB3 TaxID=2873259 RepID=UPI001CF4FA0A|nr:GtrA family protein [Cupriavidus sp. DB3]MCA7085481.1 GtrA family protein [Cupriavidus sp. DB3]